MTTSAANALGIRDAQTTALTSTPALSLVSDTQILGGGTLDTNNQTIGAEYIRFEGAGVGGGGAIVNLATGTGNTNAVFTQVEMTNAATIGGNTARFDFRSGTAGAGRFFQNGFALTKTGGNTIGIVNTQVLGGGDITTRQGTLTIDSSTVAGTGTLAVVTNGALSAVMLSWLVAVTSASLAEHFTLQGSTNLQGRHRNHDVGRDRNDHPDRRNFELYRNHRFNFASNQSIRWNNPRQLERLDQHRSFADYQHLRWWCDDVQRHR